MSLSTQEMANVDRRHFVKLVLAGVAVAAASTLLPESPLLQEATAQQVSSGLRGASIAPGTYTVTANIFTDKKDTPIGEYAYVTNPGNPPFNKPIKPVQNNATLVVQDNKMLLTVPIVNTTLGVLKLADASSDTSVSVVSGSIVKTSWGNIFSKIKERISSVTFDVTNYVEGETLVFSPSEECVTFALYQGVKHWDLFFNADFSDARKAS
ncbi:twin-arginine translocation signal domain-containing protein [Collinsella sp. AGMB00827]|uniref:Twin-arginine translocation signal domain-containing protein n=1 Tax=Collinsella ureilytica TaxID=2869515 RepID=A0ABS7MLU3_9ACTN|nr:twin-arginine translocation signal domain-containing protein [Collinsella urealyticum]MBY4798262.1 twin-arginine translocation signal domain-containing protein [Collinsella urealyticum]